jgi:plastocyanin
MGGMVMPSGTPSTAKASTPVATNAVSITNFAFSPAAITVTAGSTVVWTNNDSVQHDITFNGGGIASNVLNQNDTFSHTFPTAGTYHYICSIHPFMHGTVIVTG